jgi:hypothetical protein
MFRDDMPLFRHFLLLKNTKENFSCKYTKWIVAENMPFSAGESLEFKDIIRSLSKVVTPPAYRSTMDMLTAKKLQAITKLKAAIKGKYFHLKAGHWTSLANENFGAITLHFIANFELTAHVLSCTKHGNGACVKEMEYQLACDVGSLNTTSSLALSQIQLQI